MLRIFSTNNTCKDMCGAVESEPFRIFCVSTVYRSNRVSEALDWRVRLVEHKEYKKAACVMRYVEIT